MSSDATDSAPGEKANTSEDDKGVAVTEELAEADVDAAELAEEVPEQAGAEGTDEPPAALVVEDLTKHFGGVTAIDGASFAVAQGSLTGLIGPNGAGKSTTFNCITGVHQADGGTVRFGGADITGMRTARIASRGLVRTFQIARELQQMTVLENLMLSPRDQLGEQLTYAVMPGLRGRVQTQERELRERVWETLELFEIDHLAGEYAGNLSGGQRKLLELARALMLDPDTLLLDEPFAGVNPTLEDKLLERIHQLSDEQDLTFLLVEHDMDLIMNNCEHVIVMHQGRVLAQGTPAEIRDDERVVDAYLGEEV